MAETVDILTHSYKCQLPDVELPTERSLTEYVLKGAQRFGEHPAFIDAPTGRTIKYNELRGLSRRFGAGLAAKGFKKGDVLGICTRNCIEFVVVFHGVLSVGGVLTTMNPIYQEAELTHQLLDSGATFMIGEFDFAEKCRKAAKDAKLPDHNVFVFGDKDYLSSQCYGSLIDNDASGFPSVTISPEDVALIPYSSGTSGLPKGVLLTHFNLMSNLSQVRGAPWFYLSEKDVLIGVLPFYHSYALQMIISLPLLSGSTVVSMTQFVPRDFLANIERYRVSVAYIVPPIVLFLAKDPMVDEFDISSLRDILSGAAPLGQELVDECMQRLTDLEVTRQGYGMTELSPCCHCQPYGQGSDRAATCGMLVPNTEALIVSLDGKTLPPGERGELWIRGPQVMKGYLNNDKATAETIDRNGWLHTGDVAVVDDDGYFYIVDRIKELIKYKGFQVAPAELEAILLSHPDVADAAVIGIPDAEAGELPKAFVVRKPASSLTEFNIFSFISERVAPYKKLKMVEFIDGIPKSASGKILRRELRDREQTNEVKIKAKL